MTLCSGSLLTRNRKYNVAKNGCSPRHNTRADANLINITVESVLRPIVANCFRQTRHATNARVQVSVFLEILLRKTVSATYSARDFARGGAQDTVSPWIANRFWSSSTVDSTGLGFRGLGVQGFRGLGV